MNFAVLLQAIRPELKNGSKAHIRNCDEEELLPGTVTNQMIPALFCPPDVLAASLLRHTGSDTGGVGVRIIHLVRNPFTMAISNFKYHSADPTPENWVHTMDPCERAPSNGDPRYDVLNMASDSANGDPILGPDDMDALYGVCTDLFRSREETQGWTYYEHLRNLPVADALALATSFLVRGHVLTMVHNMIRLKQAQAAEDRERALQHKPTGGGRRLQVQTLTMDDFQDDPRGTTYRFVDFALGDSLLPGAKNEVADMNYAMYRKKVGHAKKGGTPHVTSTGSEEDNQLNQELENILREHEVLGPLMGRVEALVNGYLLTEESME